MTMSVMFLKTSNYSFVYVDFVKWKDLTESARVKYSGHVLSLRRVGL